MEIGMENSLTSKLKELKALLKAGDISEEEFQELRKQLFVMEVPPQQQTTQNGTFIGLEAGNEYGPADARFILLKELARGGMASIWKAKDIEESKRLAKESIKALKFLHPDFSHSKAHFKKLQREADNAKKLRHPNIVAVYDFKQGPDGHLFLVMEYLEGRDFAEVLVDDGAIGLPWNKVKTLMTPVAKAIAHAHNTHNIIHRDIKPANLFLTKKNEVKVIDFGLAEELKLSGSQLGIEVDERSGTKVYWSPEICESAPLAKTRDVYAFTAVVYELLTGQPPFPEQIVCHREENSQPKQPQNLDDETWKVLQKGLAYHPEERPEDIQELWNDVLNAQRRITPSKLEPSKSKGLILILVIGVVVTGILFFQSKSNSPEPNPKKTAKELTAKEKKKQDLSTPISKEKAKSKKSKELMLKALEELEQKEELITKKHLKETIKEANIDRIRADASLKRWKAKKAQEKLVPQLKNVSLGKPNEQYIDNGNGTVTDTKTSLMWKKCSEGQSGNNCSGKAKEYTWYDAMKQFNKVSFAEYNDWRIPTKEELRTLVYCSNGTPQSEAWVYSCSSKDDRNRNNYQKPTLRKDIFLNTDRAMVIWSSSPHADSRYHAWNVSFYYGNEDMGLKNNSLYVRLVRSRQ